MKKVDFTEFQLFVYNSFTCTPLWWRISSSTLNPFTSWTRTMISLKLGPNSSQINIWLCHMSWTTWPSNILSSVLRMVNLFQFFKISIWIKAEKGIKNSVKNLKIKLVPKCRVNSGNIFMTIYRFVLILQ